LQHFLVLCRLKVTILHFTVYIYCCETYLMKVSSPKLHAMVTLTLHATAKLEFLNFFQCMCRLKYVYSTNLFLLLLPVMPDSTVLVFLCTGITDLLLQYHIHPEVFRMTELNKVFMGRQLHRSSNK
jgi:hypothetical protein